MERGCVHIYTEKLWRVYAPVGTGMRTYIYIYRKSIYTYIYIERVYIERVLYIVMQRSTYIERGMGGLYCRSLFAKEPLHI